MYVYPTESFFSIYSTCNPLFGCIGAVCIILFTSIVFLLYDYYVHREFQSKSDLLHSKRQFMRYVSHEVCIYMYICFTRTLHVGYIPYFTLILTCFAIGYPTSIFSSFLKL